MGSTDWQSANNSWFFHFELFSLNKINKVEWKQTRRVESVVYILRDLQP